MILESMPFDNWNALSACCVNCNGIKPFKKHLLPELESGAYSFTVDIEIVGCIMAKAGAYLGQHWFTGKNRLTREITPNYVNGHIQE